MMIFSNSIINTVTSNTVNSSYVTVNAVTRARGASSHLYSQPDGRRPRPAVEEWGEELCTFLSQLLKISLTALLLLCRDFTFTFKGSILQVHPYWGPITVTLAFSSKMYTLAHGLRTIFRRANY